MSTIGALLKDLNKRHTEYSEVNDIKAIASLIPEYENLLNHMPNELPILFGLATVKLQCGFNGSAIALFQQALIDHEDTPEVWNNLGSAWMAENKRDKAKECYEKALALRDDADYHNNICTLYINEGVPEKAEKWALSGLEVDSTHPRLHWNYGLALLEQGKWEKGFKQYECGLHSYDRPNRNYGEGIDFWDGTPGQRVVVYGEQGVGDELMYASCIPDLMKDCEVVLDCHDRLLGLFERSFDLKCFPTRKKNTIEWPHGEKPFDARIAIGSLFKHYRSDGNFPKVAYLKPDMEKVKKYRKKFEALGPGPYVGIGWRAGMKKTRNDVRSLKLSWFNPIFEQGGTFISIQYTKDSLDKTERFYHDHGHKIHHWPQAVETGPKEDRYPGMDYDETVALIAALDLVICPNTTAVHLCGAIGQQCWTLTPKACAWRYQLEGEHMPMYGPWVRQFRETDSWQDLIEEVAREYGYLEAA